MSARLIQVIESTVCRGKGTVDDVSREVTQYWSTDGRLLAESDPCPGGAIEEETPVELEWKLKPKCPHGVPSPNKCSLCIGGV